MLSPPLFAWIDEVDFDVVVAVVAAIVVGGVEIVVEACCSDELLKNTDDEEEDAEDTWDVVEVEPADEGDGRSGEPTDDEASVGSLLVVDISFISGDDDELTELVELDCSTLDAGVVVVVAVDSNVVVVVAVVVSNLFKSIFFIRLLLLLVGDVDVVVDDVVAVVVPILAITYFVVVCWFWFGKIEQIFASLVGFVCCCCIGSTASIVVVFVFRPEFAWLLSILLVDGINAFGLTLIYV